MIGVAVYISISEWCSMAKLSKHPWEIGALGSVYIVVCMMAFVYLRNHQEDGSGLALALMLCVWASDIGAFFSGKTFGGPKMAPAISPNKTWAGLIGGIVASAFALLLFALYAGPWLTNILERDMDILEGAEFMIVLAVGASVTISGQIGDLLISKQKRSVGVKDTGHLIPGHGGLLDRIDSLLLAAPVFLVTLKVLGL